MECVFCRIIARQEPAAVVRETGEVLAFMNIAPATEGHVLVVPKRHARGILDIPDKDLRQVASVAKSIAALQMDRLGCAGVTLFQANEPAGWQSVFHYHVHVVPRFVGDGLIPPWRSAPVDPPILERIAQVLRQGDRDRGSARRADGL